MKKTIGLLSATTLLGILALVAPGLAITPQVPITEALPKGYVKTAPVIKPVNKDLKEGKSCATSNFGWAVVGFLKNGQVGYIKCDLTKKKYVVDTNLPKIQQSTLQPLIKSTVPAKTTFGYSPQVYIYPVVSKSKPKTSISETTAFEDVEPCKLPELDTTGRPHMASGFDMPAERAVLDEHLIVQVVPVDFADLRTSSKPANDLADAVKSVEAFWERQSTSKINIDFRIPKSYIQLPKKVGDYKLSSKFPNFDGAAYSNYVKAIVEVADPLLDFSDVDIVILAHTPKATAAQIGTFIAEAGMPGSSFAFGSIEKTVLNVMIQGGDQPRDIQNWIHEFGHMLGVTDSGGEGKMGFDVMLWYGVPELTVWNRFILGIEGDKQIACKTNTKTSTHWLRPVAWPGTALEGLVIPISEGRAIVVESRRRTGYDALLGKESEGALVYEVDTSKSGNNGSGPFKILGPKRMTTIAMWSLDAPLKKGESITHAGWKITNVESGAFGDVVKAEKIN